MRKHCNYGLAIERPGGTPGVVAQGGGDAGRAAQGIALLTPGRARVCSSGRGSALSTAADERGRSDSFSAPARSAWLKADHAGEDRN